LRRSVGLQADPAAIESERAAMAAEQAARATASGEKKA
jgi:hypothetical protein